MIEDRIMIEFVQANLPKVEFVLAAWIGVVIAVFIDLLTGLYKAKSLNYLITSDGLKRTVSKLVLYFAFLSFAGFIDIMTFGLEFFTIPYASLLFSIFVFVIEGKSVFERANEKERKRLIGGAKDVTAVLASKDEIIKAIHDYINEKTQENETKQ